MLLLCKKLWFPYLIISKSALYLTLTLTVLCNWNVFLTASPNIYVTRSHDATTWKLFHFLGCLSWLLSVSSVCHFSKYKDQFLSCRMMNVTYLPIVYWDFNRRSESGFRRYPRSLTQSPRVYLGLPVDKLACNPILMTWLVAEFTSWPYPIIRGDQLLNMEMTQYYDWAKLILNIYEDAIVTALFTIQLWLFVSRDAFDRGWARTVNTHDTF